MRWSMPRLTRHLPVVGVAAALTIGVISCVSFEGEIPECFPDEGVCGEGQACVANRCVTATDGNINPGDVGPVPDLDPEADARVCLEIELCNDIDDDCDGRTDEDYPQLNTPCTVGQGVCAVPGVMRCHPNEPESDPICRAESGSPIAETCNGIDDDCDGLIDEDFPMVGQVCTAGSGGCAVEGLRICNGDGTMVICDAQPRMPEPERCDENDGVDNDCDGEVDEAFALVNQVCQTGVGACERRGILRCDGPDLTDPVCSAMPGEPAPNDATCNNIDDDCDGRIDENFAPMVIQCGIGACVNEGTQRCTDGELVNICEPAGGEAADPCNNIDDDCDGQIDEDAPVTLIECGVGFCQATGERRCVAGEVVDRCEPGNPLPNDLCDRLDGDCDGRIDEDHVEIVTDCGIGACAREGVLQCGPQGIFDSCEPGQPADREIACQGQDEDCDGTIDEGCP
ncbi:MAG: MopE-related protein [Bradymonadia bacterium]